MTVRRYPDQVALARVGESVRIRLAADPWVYRVPTDAAEIYAIGSFLSGDECAHLIDAIERVAKPSHVYHSVEQGKYRTSYSGDLDARDSFVKMVERRLGDLTGIDLAWGETIQGQRYHPGQEFRAHYDWFDVEADYWAAERESGGQRSWTGMVYLNDVEAGGVTEFTKLDIRIEPQAGALILWNNALPDGTPNPDVLHAAHPVERGVKYVITKWFRARRWR